MSLATIEEHDRMDALDSVGDSQLSYSADTESESNSSSTCCSSSSSTKTVSLLDRLRAPISSTLARKQKIGVNSVPPQGKKRASGQEENIYYKNNRGSFGELDNNWKEKKNNVLRPTPSPPLHMHCMYRAPTCPVTLPQ